MVNVLEDQLRICWKWKRFYSFAPLLASTLVLNCQSVRFSNVCDPNNKDYTLSILWKAISGDVSPHCGRLLDASLSTSNFKIGGVISGLLTTELVLQNNKSDDIAVEYLGNSFLFPTKTSSYNVTVKSSPLADCIISNGSGKAIADVSNISVSCSLKTLSIAGNVTTIAGNSQGFSNGTGTSALFNMPQGLASDGTNLYIADNQNNNIRKMDLATGLVTSIAGSTSASSGFANGIGTTASFSGPQTIFYDGTNLYISDVLNNLIRKIVLASGEVTTIAGSGASGNIDGIGTNATFANPLGIASDGKNLYITNFALHTIRKIDLATNSVTTIAGIASSPGNTNGNGLSAQLNFPADVVFDGTNLYIADYQNNQIRKMVVSSSTVSTVAGSGTAGASDGTGLSASFNLPQDILMDGTYFYIADRQNNLIRKMEIATGVVTTIAGSGTAGNADGNGTSATFNTPQGITTDGISLYISDSLNHRIRKIQ
ncbi:hypothetical protein [Leptospira ilyithenensis]|uniref:Uncharacterized protein n=1 Tax=Leptospira ilyithenensis TaxID=2484901 RepID=A0A4R9LRU7_9LEPT|nr:hypothetical protein [Leptospira ilyithenensis]TGN09383.1 hypothetical protein EHS11_12605 [Leptospira ilyithenensis]